MPSTSSDPSTALPHDQPGDETPPGTPQSAEGLCPRCGGSGHLEGGVCPDCGGGGTVNVIVGDA